MPRRAALLAFASAFALAFLATTACARAEPPGRAEWDAFLAQPSNKAAYGKFVAYLASQNVARVVEPSELLRQGTDWKRLGAAPFAVPPEELWPNIVPVLRFVEKELEPHLGELEVLSAYRTEGYNEPAGGARHSRHRSFEALDLQPKKDLAREDLRAKLASIWKAKGKENRLGLGLYGGTRFHVDRWRYRTW
ncbi:MAG TPA: D-Ala-D-Ala carboxypeptidase family metallohydrolase [Myxococcales bacterium]|jgi:hypothetical protein